MHLDSLPVKQTDMTINSQIYKYSLSELIQCQAIVACIEFSFFYLRIVVKYNKSKECPDVGQKHPKGTA